MERGPDRGGRLMRPRLGHIQFLNCLPLYYGLVDFMESVWWVFKSLWDNDLIYQDFKVLPYSWGATTPLSNFEANLDYRDVDDPAITVALTVTKTHGPVDEGHDGLGHAVDWILVDQPGDAASRVLAHEQIPRVGSGVVAAPRMEHQAPERGPGGP